MGIDWVGKWTAFGVLADFQIIISTMGGRATMELPDVRFQNILQILV
jgi:hypothetical protein